MCLQCDVDAKEVIRFVLPPDENAPKDSIEALGWHLYIATKDGEPSQWPKGWYGLLRINNPDFIFPLEDNPDWNEVYDAFECSPAIGHAFYEACTRAGYNKKDEPFMNVETWFVKRLIKMLKETKQ